MRHFLLLIIGCYCNSGGYAQNQLNNWYFGGKAGATFNTTPPSGLTNGLLSTTEGSAVMSDKNGSLLFYTDGAKVWDKTHQIMPNGSGLKSNSSTTQSSIIVPLPCNDSIYYIFTVAGETGTFATDSVFAYSIVDMSLNNGFGDIITKNQKLFSPTAEKIAAIIHSNGVDIWVVGLKYASNSFYAYLLTKNGLSGPFISTVGLPEMAGAGARGQMKFSTDGKKLVAAYWANPSLSSSNIGHIQLFDFDASTGSISNATTIVNSHAYGIDFSPDNTKIYYTKGLEIWQYDLVTITNNLVGTAAGQVQRGPDGKIYFNNPSPDHLFLGVINFPNNDVSSCGHSPYGVDLKGKSGSIGLPNFMVGLGADISPPIVNLGNDSIICTGEKLNLSAENTGSIYSWSTGSSTMDIVIDTSGTYWVSVSKTNGCISTDSIVFKECDPPVYLPNTFTPNNDGINDLFLAKSGESDFDTFNLKIFNRWGNLIFEGTAIDKGWDGTFSKTPSPEEIYPYVLSYSIRGLQVKKRGYVLLVR